MKKKYYYYFLAGGALFLLLVILGPVLTLAVPLDDVYIHCRYAYNLLEGNGYCFNPGPTVTADTSPLWVLLIAAGGLITSHLEAVAVILSAVCHLLLFVGMYKLTRIVEIPEYWAHLIALLTFISGRLIWAAMSGMEVSLACAIVVWVFWSYFVGRTRLTAILLALGVATRPELWLLVAIIVIDTIVQLVKKESTVGKTVTNVGIFIILVLPVLLLPFFERGSFVFHSSEVQGARMSLVPNWGYLWFIAKILFITVTPPFIFGLGGVYYFRKNRPYRLIALFAFGLPLLLAFVAPQFRHHGRYFFPAIPLVILLGVAFIGIQLQRFMRSDPWEQFWVKHHLAFRVLFLIASVTLVRWIGIASDSAANIREQHVAASKWIETNASPAEVIASHDVGAIGYFTKRPVIDLVGLVTPEIYPLLHDQRLVWQYARSKGANVFVIYNRLNPTFYEYAQDSLELQTSFRVEPLVSSADTVLSIYRVKEYAAD